MNRKICYPILLLVHVLGALFQVFMLLSGEPENGENLPVIVLSLLLLLLWLTFQVILTVSIMKRMMKSCIMVLKENIKKKGRESYDRPRETF